MYSLEDKKLVSNLATRACGGTVVYPGGVLESNSSGFAFYHVYLKHIGIVPNMSNRPLGALQSSKEG